MYSLRAASYLDLYSAALATDCASVYPIRLVYSLSHLPICCLSLMVFACFSNSSRALSAVALSSAQRACPDFVFSSRLKNSFNIYRGRNFLPRGNVFTLPHKSETNKINTLIQV